MKRIPLKSDSEIKTAESNDNYELRKKVKWVIFYLGCAVVAVIVALFIKKMICDETFCNQILELIKTNFSGIIFFVLALFGIKILK